MEFVDLHVHTTASDGSFRPDEVVKMALDKGLFAIAITDHDTIAGIPYALEAAYGTPLHIIPGVELSTSYKDKEIHVLGYNIDFEKKFFVDTLEKVEYLRLERNNKMCELMREQGVDITIEALYEKANSRALTRGNMGRYLIEHGYVSSMQEAFDKYIGNSAPCYVPRFKLSLEDVYKLITYAGGVCSLAHPVQYKLSDKKYDNLFKKIKSLGFKCVEGYHSDNTVYDEEKFIRLALKNDLLLTGGSDFHGASKPDIKIGTGKGNLMIPRSILANIGLR